VPLQGSGTFSVEAAIGTLVPRDGKVLVPNNGAYCARIVRICGYLGRGVVDLPVPEDQPATAAMVETALAATRRSRMSRRCTAKPAPVC
jgi:2-aminoethylphosphonate-pyruvate transaminase